MPKRISLSRLVARILLAAVVAFSPFQAPYVRASSPIVIGEVAWAGSSMSLADEWIEIWNLGDTDASLAGYSVVGASTNPITFPDDAVIPAHGTYLVSNYAADDPKSALAATPQLVTTSVSLSNSVLSVALLDGNGTEVDRAGDRGAPPAGATGDVKATMVRDGDAWLSATASVGFDAGRTDLGTPGVCDGCVSATEEPPPVIEEPPTDAVATTTEPIPSGTEAPTTTDMTVPDETVPSSTDIVATSTDPVPNPSDGTGTVSSSDPVPVDIPTETASSTEPIPPAQADLTASSTDSAPETDSASTTEAVPVLEVASSSDAVPTGLTETPQIPSPPRYDLLRLNEIMPQPDGEAEWLEITTLDPSVPVPLTGVQLHDATGKVFVFATGTVDATTPYVRAVLSSSRLNNGGDTVSVRSPDGTAIDMLTYDGSEKGHPWAREDDATGPWTITLTPTPELANVITEPEDPADATEPVVAATAVQSTAVVAPIVPVAASVSLPAPVPTAATKSTATQSALAAPATTKKTTSPSTPKLPRAATTTTATAKTPATKTTASVSSAKKTTTTKTTAKTTSSKTVATKTVEPPLITIAMTSSDTYRGIRVTLQGTVGSPSGLLTSHGFILLAPDGRGLLVRVPTAMKLPSQDTAVRVTGTLQFDDLDIPSLKLGTKDGWTVLPDGSPKPSPRSTDLLAPGSEDRWCLVSATGTVVRVQGTNVTISVDDADVVVAIRKVVDYRANRLAVGDTIHVTGLLDMSGASPRILPRMPDEIELLTHAAPKTSAATKPTLPGWTPFGAAGLAVAGTEGAKQLRERMKRRSLEKMLEIGSNTATDI